MYGVSSASAAVLPRSTLTSIARSSRRRSLSRPSSPPIRRFPTVSPTVHHLAGGRICCSFSSPSMPVDDDPSTSQLDDRLLYARAYWVSESIIAWNVEVGSHSCYLFASKMASLSMTDDEVKGYDVKIKLEEDCGSLPENVDTIVDDNCLIFEIPATDCLLAFSYSTYYLNLRIFTTLKPVSRAELCFDINVLANGVCQHVTGLQLPGVLDDLFAYNGPLGVQYIEGAISMYLWAPTAQAVHACIYRDPSGRDLLEVKQLKEVNGVWSSTGPNSWDGCYYEYEVTVYHHTTLQIEKCYTNDPYARGLSPDGRRTLFVNMGSNSLKPDQWDNLADEKPQVQCFSDMSIYELHIRDFSASDHSVSPDFRGGYMAFTLQDSAGMLHLKRLSSAGLTHIHLLPTFQFAGVDDEKENWESVDTKILETFPSDSTEQQALITAVQDNDGYNWGYNPVLWGVPKGSYATNPSGPCRIIEFRKMVQALNHLGIRVVLDVVYNHLHGSGPSDPDSVLDKIVPGYYLRRNTDGFIMHSTCVNNTASEHFMAERLIIDDLLHWVINYKVDGFRFDLMGHIMKSTMLKAKEALRSLTKDSNGVDGSNIYIYGEGWDFGEVARNMRGINASQFNLFGTGIGSFNDRIRDAILGGSPFGHPLQQGFVTGLLLQPNGHDHGTKEAVQYMLGTSKDHIQVGMAANLRDYVLTNFEGKAVKGSEILTHDGSAVAYVSCPTETINYASAHDNETLFDVISLKAPLDLSMDARCRMNYLVTSIIALSQGIPFFHAGDELLRSKSMDRDSYNSGDWFNRLDFTYKSNNWGSGLPPKEKNEKNWPLIKQRLADQSLKPTSNHILAAVENFVNILQIRYSSPLFRLKTANDIQGRVRFHNTGLSSIPGVIVMSIEDGHKGIPGLSQLDHIYSYIVVIVNARPTEVAFARAVWRERNFQLHPLQLMSNDAIVKNSTYKACTGCFCVPSMTTSVFVESRESDTHFSSEM